jgi:serine/threonine-protein kinase
MPAPNTNDSLRTTDSEPIVEPEATPDALSVPQNEARSSAIAGQTTAPYQQNLTEEQHDGVSESHSKPTLPSIPDYAIEGLLGRGGMGIVYLARQVQLKRLVALKMIRGAELTGPQEQERFRVEAEAAARLQHPNVVQIFEVGEVQGQPFLALEYVQGGSLANKLGGTPLPAREGVKLAETIARAVQAAHVQGVIHRDLKPSNVLLTGDGVPKISDFGLAKQLGADSGQTQVGQILGTPSYMAPEQACGGAVAVTAAADVYAVGAILYEMLTGRPPFRAASVLDTLEQVRTQEPVPPTRLQPKCPRDLETICLKCLHKDPQQRYPSCEALADDLRRFLVYEPIQARPTGSIERLWRWCRRKPALASLAASAALLLVTVVIALSVGLWAVNREKTRAERALTAEAQARQRTRQALDEMSSQVIDDWLSRQKYLEPIHQAFLEKALQYYEEFAQEAGDTEEIRHDVARAYLRVGEIQQKLGNHEQAEAALRHSQEVFNQLVADFPASAGHKRELARSHDGLGILLKETGRLDGAEVAFGAELALIRQLVEDFPETPQYREDLAASHNSMATLLEVTGRTKVAEEHFREALVICKLLDTDFPDEPRYRHRLAKAYNNWGALLRLTSRSKEAEDAFRAALEISAKLVAALPSVPDYRDTRADSYHSLGIILAFSNRLEDAATAYREALALNKRLAADFPSVPDYRAALARGHSNLGRVLRKLKRLKDAEEAYREAVVIQQRLIEEFPKVTQNRVELAFSHNLLGVLFDSSGQLQEAEKPYRDALAQRKLLAEEFPKVPEYQNDVAGTLGNLARLSRKRKELAQARQLLQEAQPYHRAALKADDRHPFFRQFFCNNQSLLGEILADLGEHAAAVEATKPLVRYAYQPRGDIYDAACIVSRCVPLAEKDAALPEARCQELARSYADQAMELLRQAVANGYKDAAHMKEDKDLKALRGRADFQKLLHDLESEARGKAN